MKSSLERILSKIPDTLFEFLTDRKGNGTCVYLSEGIHKLSGCRPEEISSLKDLFPLIHPEDLSKFEQYVYHSDRQTSWEWSGRIIHQENRNIHTWVLASVDCQLVDEGQLSVLGIIKNMSETSLMGQRFSQVQAQMLQAEKMASLGKLLAGIAHEINNPINFVYSNLTPLDRDIKDLHLIIEAFMNLADQQGHQESQKAILGDFEYEIIKEEIQSLLEGLREGASRTREIVSGLKNFSRIDGEEFQLTNIHEIIDSTLILLGNIIKHKVSIKKKYGDIPLINCQAGKLNQVFMNLLSNAIQAIEDYGEVVIITEQIDQQVQIIITDDGIGMDQETLERIFEPFFTTKERGKGTGLGLSITKEIIEQHQGTIQVDSRKDKGTTFTILLPIHSEANHLLES